MTFKAIGDSVIVKLTVAAKQSTTDSGLVLIEKGREGATAVAEIISIGEGKFDYKNGVHVPPPVKIGDKIVMSLSTGMKLDELHRVVRTDDIFAVVE